MNGVMLAWLHIEASWLWPVRSCNTLLRDIKDKIHCREEAEAIKKHDLKYLDGVLFVVFF